MSETTNRRRTEDAVLRGYYNEYENDVLISLAQYSDDHNVKDGHGFIFIDGVLVKECSYTNGEETRILATFIEDQMIRYNDDRKRIYEGHYSGTPQTGIKKSGEGCEFDDDGMTLLYKGSFEDDKKSGKGSFYKDGMPYYVGMWKDDYPNGDGKILVDDMPKYSGNWINGFFPVEGGVIDYSSGSLLKTNKKETKNLWEQRGGTGHVPGSSLKSNSKARRELPVSGITPSHSRKGCSCLCCVWVTLGAILLLLIAGVITFLFTVSIVSNAPGLQAASKKTVIVYHYKDDLTLSASRVRHLVIRDSSELGAIDIRNNEYLKRIRVASNSGSVNSTHTSIVISHCPSLISIEFQCHTMLFAKTMTLTDLPSLHVLKLGTSALNTDENSFSTLQSLSISGICHVNDMTQAWNRSNKSQSAQTPSQVSRALFSRVGVSGE